MKLTRRGLLTVAAPLPVIAKIRTSPSAACTVPKVRLTREQRELIDMLRFPLGDSQIYGDMNSIAAAIIGKGETQ